MQSHKFSDFMVLDTIKDSDMWFGTLDLSNKILMDKYVGHTSLYEQRTIQTMSTLSVQLSTPCILSQKDFASWAEGLGVLLGLGL